MRRDELSYLSSVRHMRSELQPASTLGHSLRIFARAFVVEVWSKQVLSAAMSRIPALLFRISQMNDRPWALECARSQV